MPPAPGYPDEAARLEAAKASLIKQRAVLVRAGSAGRPCTRCKHLINVARVWHHPRRFCTHPAYDGEELEPVRHLYIDPPGKLAGRARAADGLCGPQARLIAPNWLAPVDDVLGLVGSLWLPMVRAFAVIGVPAFLVMLLLIAARFF